MAFKTSAEKKAYKAGIRKGQKGGKIWVKKKDKKPSTPKPGAYNSRGPINKFSVYDLDDWNISYAEMAEATAKKPFVRALLGEED